MSRFEKPTLVSSGLGITLASANCNETWSGTFEGYWSLQCSLRAPIDHHAEESVQSAQAQAYALHYIRAHRHRFGPVELARLGRAFGVFHPLQQIELDSYVETRPYHWALVGLGMYYAFVVLGAGGTVVLRRRRVPVFPLLALGVDVVATVLLSFGQTRYRTTFEVSLVLLSAVALDRLWDGARSSGPPADIVAASPEPSPPADRSGRTGAGAVAARDHAGPPTTPDGSSAAGWAARRGGSWPWPTPPPEPGRRRRSRGTTPGTTRRSTGRRG